MNIPFENVVMLIGAAQGALIGLIIVQKHTALYANRFLALMMFVISALLVHMVVDDMGMYRSAPILMPVLLALSLVVTPLHFLYAKFLTNRSLRFGIRDAVHFIPYCVFLVLGEAMLPTSVTGRNVFIEHHSIQQYPMAFLFFNWVLIAQGLSYVVVVLYRIGEYENEIRKVYSSVENRQLHWLRNITFLALAAWCFFIIEQTFLSFHINLSNFMISSILLAVYLFTLGYLGLLKAEVLEASSPEEEIALTQEVLVPVVADASKYEKSGLSADTAREYTLKILQAMEQEKPYRQCDLTLSQLAGSVQVSPHNLSEVINTQLGKTFYDLVNEYRIREVKEALVDPSKKHLKILAIAYDAGFNSKASFNTVFKNLTDTTPSEYRKLQSLAEGRD